MPPFMPARAKLTIGSLDDPKLEVSAQYNPKEIELQRSIGWKSHNTHNVPHHRRHEQETAALESDLEYTGGEGRSLSIEMLFDGFETQTSVEPQMEVLDEMATSRDPQTTNATHDQRRPHQCVVVWGAKGMRPLLCVIESLSVKYTMFDSDGRPLRGVATVKVKEAAVSRVTYNSLDTQKDRPRTVRAKGWAGSTRTNSNG
jgi:contractile injection system tube protein